MKRDDKNNKGVVKGAPSGLVISLIVHVAAFMLAGLLVVFSVSNKKEKKFAPPKPIDRPKMKLKKPQVKVKKSAKPKSSQRIVTNVKRASMPDIQLPEMSGIGDGIGPGGGVGGFDIIPDLNDISILGSGQSIGNDFVGTFYDLKRDRSGRSVPMNPEAQVELLSKFIKGGWKPSKLARYYRSPKKLYTTCFMVPPTLSSIAPGLFGEPETAGYLWMVHYKGQLVHKEAMTFRFFATSDQYMVIRVGGKVVNSSAWAESDAVLLTPQWHSSSADNRKYRMGVDRLSVAGDWITLEAGIPLDMEVLFAEGNGGGFQAMIVVEVEGEEYELNDIGDPIFPMFKTAEPSRDLLDAILELLVPGEADPTNGPVFCDYGRSGAIAAAKEPEAVTPPPVFADAVENEVRTWTLKNKQSAEAKFVTVIGDKAVLMDQRGQQQKVALVQLSEEDRTYIELVMPPKFNIDFYKKSSQVIVDVDTPYFTAGSILGRSDFNYVFGARLKAISAGNYNHELKVEFFAIGEEIDGDNYILLDRQESRFTPTKENERSHTFHGDPIRLTKSFTSFRTWGAKYGGYLVVVTDERGMIVELDTSHKWLLDILGKLRHLPVGKHFDKTGTRSFPPSPTRWNW